MEVTKNDFYRQIMHSNYRGLWAAIFVSRDITNPDLFAVFEINRIDNVHFKRLLICVSRMFDLDASTAVYGLHNEWRSTW